MIFSINKRPAATFRIFRSNLSKHETFCGNETPIDIFNEICVDINVSVAVPLDSLYYLPKADMSGIIRMVLTHSQMNNMLVCMSTMRKM